MKDILINSTNVVQQLSNKLIDLNNKTNEKILQENQYSLLFDKSNQLLSLFNNNNNNDSANAIEYHFTVFDSGDIQGNYYLIDPPSDMHSVYSRQLKVYTNGKVYCAFCTNYWTGYTYTNDLTKDPIQEQYRLAYEMQGDYDIDTVPYGGTKNVRSLLYLNPDKTIVIQNCTGEYAKYNGEYIYEKDNENTNEYGYIFKSSAGYTIKFYGGYGLHYWVDEKLIIRYALPNTVCANNYTVIGDIRYK